MATDLYNLTELMQGFYTLEDLALRFRPTGVYTCEMPRPKTVVERQAFWRAQGKESLAYRNRELVENTRADYNDQLGALLFDYIVTICLGEARHAPTQIHRWLPKLYPKRQPGLIPQRSQVYQMAHQFNPRSALRQCVRLFGYHDWSSSYGGKAWKRIAEAGLLYFEMPVSVFIDHVADLSHNGGLAFDKGVYLHCNRDAYLDLLNRKRDGSILEQLDYVLTMPRQVTAVVESVRVPRYVVPTPAFQYVGVEYGKMSVGYIRKSPREIKVSHDVTCRQCGGCLGCGVCTC